VTSGRQAPRFDLALHFRHVTVEKQACQSCHHVFDETAQKLVYRKGTEEACAVCHAEKDQGARLSLRKAAHRSCVGCHLERGQSGTRVGPTTCQGCHGGLVPAGLARPAATGRLAALAGGRAYPGAALA
ncbi:MAG: cytochrome c3 family protein, partial [Anaerolineae bacterium]|nr:cytochrome c3 family protein [Anaerolineae bacterium]